MSTYRINDRFDITTDHAASSYGQPVLVDSTTGDVFGPDDDINPQGYIFGPETARDFLSDAMIGQIATMREAIAKHHGKQWLSDEEINMIEKFTA